jgi:hypothetical protein
VERDPALSLPSDAPRVSRARSSKIQNHKIKLVVGDTVLSWYTDLQVMEKNACTLAMTFVVTLERILEAIVGEPGAEAPPQRQVFLHLATGDGVQTDEGALRRILVYFRNTSRFKISVDYKLIVWLCAGHKACLAAMAAICGRVMAKPIEGSAICCNAVRLYK